MPKITLDAGHYGEYNRSPVVKEYYESHMTWKLHLMLKEELEKRGFEVNVTREKQEEDLELTKRGKKAKGSDLFISLHSNAWSDPTIDRVVIFRAYDNLNNASELGGIFGRTVADVMGVKSYEQLTRTLESGKDEYYGVLRGARSVGCPLFYIIEHSFHTNEYAARFLLKDENLRKIAVAEAEVIAAYFATDIKLDEERFRVHGIKPRTTVKTLISALGRRGIDAAVYKDEGAFIGTGDAIYIGNDMYIAVVKGDVSGDGIMDDNDALLMKRHIIGTKLLPGVYAEAADMNDDGRVNATDYLILKRMIRKQK